MLASFEELKRDLEIATRFFLENIHARQMPFMGLYPKNACEPTTALLVTALKKKYKNSRVVYVRGKSEINGGMHFWVEIDDLVLDPTAHQFSAFKNPLICKKPNPLEKNFQGKIMMSDPESETDLKSISKGVWDLALIDLCDVLDIEKHRAELL